VAGQRGVDVSGREAEVLAAVGEHLTNAEIAARLVISVRTVESHVSSLLRKLGVADRRALAAAAGNRRAALPSALTPFVGRVAERAALRQALREHRLVTAVGPGGVGKTRLALSVAADLADRYADGAWYVDLVPVTDPTMVAPAIADALGLGERQGSSATDDVVGWLAGREALLVLDNCEHLLDGVVVLLERLLAGSPGSVVLATSRARLLVPYERVFPVPGFPVDTAVELFRGRAAAGGRAPEDRDTPRIEAICTALDGMALAIELAAARFPSLGLDGLETGLADRLRLLTGGPRLQNRHRSLRAALDWSYALLAGPGQAVLRRVSVFAEPFGAATAAAVADWAPVPPHAVPGILADLADQSLLIATAGPDGTRYQALETVRQYGVERLDETGETERARSGHLSWALAEATRSTTRTGFDQVADELRAALSWAAAHDRPEAYELATTLAHLSFLRGTPSESQRRYEQAAELAPDDRAAADALRAAAGAAESRHVGDDAVRLRETAAGLAALAGDRAGAAADLARTAELLNRGPGLMATRPAPGQAAALIARGRALTDGDLTAESRLLTAEAFDSPPADPGVVRLVDRALALARQVRDPLAESAALDVLTSIQLARGDVGGAASSALLRTELLAPVPVTATAGLEFFDAFVMAAECAVAAGRLDRARGLAERLRDLPFYREEAHLATARLIVVTALAGDWAETVALAERFREGWERAGRPRAGNLGQAAYAAATVHGLRGDDAARADWLEIVRALETPGRPVSQIHYGEFFDALLLLHRGRPEEAAALLRTPPEELTRWYSGMWRPWYAAVWAEAAILSGDPGDRVQRARAATAGNPVAAAIVGRTDGPPAAVAAAGAVRDAGCRYQEARTLVMIGGDHRVRGEAALKAMGATPMAWPPG
jgi:predicted ATPase/DNA-binding CsgD family transcriptional regulator